PRSLSGAWTRRVFGEGGHCRAPEASEALAAALASARSAAIDQHITDPDAAQLVELLGDLAGGAIDRTVAVDDVGIAGGAIGTAMTVPSARVASFNWRTRLARRRSSAVSFSASLSQTKNARVTPTWDLASASTMSTQKPANCL